MGQLTAPSDSMKPAEQLQVRTCSPAFVDAHIRRFLIGTLYEHGQLSVVYDHEVGLNPEEGEEGRSGDLDLEMQMVSVDATSARSSPSHVSDETQCVPLLAGCPRRPLARSAP